MKKVEGKAQRKEEKRKAFFHFYYYVAKIYFFSICYFIITVGFGIDLIVLYSCCEMRYDMIHGAIIIIKYVIA
jgi:hypothetical protein